MNVGTRLAGAAAFATLTSVLVACGGGGGGAPIDQPPATATYRVGGTVQGLKGIGLALRLNEQATLTVGANGAFTFDVPLASGAAFTVSVATQPQGQTCTVAEWAGAVGTSDVTSVSVTCTDIPVAARFRIGGEVSGLTGGTVTLRLNGGDPLAASTNGPFQFPVLLTNLAAYDVIVAGQPEGQVCAIVAGTGSVAAADVSTVSVACAAIPPEPVYALRGTISGLTDGTLTLSVNGTYSAAFGANVAFTLRPTLTAGDAYEVTVSTQPPGQTCIVTSGSGVMPAADVESITVTCADNPPPPLAVIRMEPAAEATNVARAVQPVLTFDRPPDPATLGPGALRLTGPLGIEWPISVEIDAETLRVRPDLVLPGDTEYALTVADSVAARDGATLATTYASAFRTSAQSWGPHAIELAALSRERTSSQPDALLALPDRRFVALSFDHPDSGSSTMLVSATAAGTGAWEAPRQVETALAGNTAGGPLAVVENSTEIRLIWGESGGSAGFEIRTLTYSIADGRSTTPSTIRAVPSDIIPGNLATASDGQGSTLVLTRGYFPLGPGASLYFVRRDPVTSSWSEPVELPGVDERVSDPGIWFDRRGGAIALWTVRPSDRMPYLMAARLDLGTGTWSEPVHLADDVGGLLGENTLVADDKGRVTVAWTHWIGVGGSPQIHVSRFDPAIDRWTAPVRLDRLSPSESVYHPAMGIDAAGRVLVVWGEFTGLKAARLDPLLGTWSEPVPFGPSRGNGTQLVVDPLGNAVVFTSPGVGIFALRYSATDDRWSDAERIDDMVTGLATFAGSPRIAVNAAGDVAALWYATLEDPSRRAVLAARVLR